jgi:hypothetical protein
VALLASRIDGVVSAEPSWSAALHDRPVFGDDSCLRPDSNLFESFGKDSNLL